MHGKSIVLMYHRLVADRGDMDAVPPAERIYTGTAGEFANHLRAIRKSGWRPVQPEALSERPAGRRLLITFDDSCESHYTTALPLLREHEMCAVFFITVSEVGRPGCVTWEQLREMHEAGMAVQSHGYTHGFMPGLSRRELTDELRRSRGEIQEHVGCEVTMLSFPGGRCSRRAVDIARECGYSLIFGSSVGVNPGGEAPVLKRVPITSRVDGARISRILSNPARGLLGSRLRFEATRLARSLFGEALYGALRGLALHRVRRGVLYQP